MAQTQTPKTKTDFDLKASVVGGFFLGEIQERNLFPYPAVRESEVETLKMVVESIDRFMSGKAESYREYDKKGEQPAEYIESLRELGLFGLIIPEEYGGIGLSNVGYSRVLQQSSYYDASTSLTIGAHSSIGMKGLLLFGSPDQKQRYLPKLASGEMIAAFCLTEPGAGSDAGAVKTKAVKNADGSWTLNGGKIWITNGGIADFFTVFARTDSEEGKMSAFLVERSFTGVTNGPKEDKMGIRSSITTTVEFNNVQVPAANLLGVEGKGFKIAMAVLNNGRTGLGGGCVGAMKRCIEMSSRQAQERKQFGKSIGDFYLVKEKIAQMTLDCFTTESVVGLVGAYIDSGVENYSMEAAVSKIIATESLWRTANEALQIAGGNGFMREYPYERLVRDCRINMIFEGTNEVLRLFVALSGMKDAGDYLKDVGRGLGKIFHDPIKGFGVLGSYASKKMAQVTTFGRDKIDFVPEVFSKEARTLEGQLADFAKATEAVLRKYGKEVIGKQFEMKRLADMACDLFSALAVLARVSTMIASKGEAACAQEIEMARVISHQCKRRINHNITALAKNDDAELVRLADNIMAEGKYRWDLI
jgi:acyl-CoA dehydrogenase family protein 9